MSLTSFVRSIGALEKAVVVVGEPILDDRFQMRWTVLHEALEFVEQLAAAPRRIFLKQPSQNFARVLLPRLTLRSLHSQVHVSHVTSPITSDVAARMAVF